MLLKHQTAARLRLSTSSSACSNGLTARLPARCSTARSRSARSFVLVGLAVAGAELSSVQHAASRSSPRSRTAAPSSASSCAPEGSTIDYTDALRAARSRRSSPAIPEADRVFVVAGFPTSRKASPSSRLKPWDERERSQQEIAERWRRSCQQLPGVIAFPINPPSLGQSARSKPIEFVMQTSRPYAELQQHGRAAARRGARRSRPRQSSTPTCKLNKPQLDVAVDRDKAADLGIQVDDASAARSRRCSAAARSRASSARASSTT